MALPLLKEVIVGYDDVGTGSDMILPLFVIVGLFPECITPES
jgi:hypothetical protein